MGWRRAGILTITVGLAVLAGLVTSHQSRASSSTASLAQVDGTLGAVERCDDFFIDSVLSGLDFLPLIGGLFGDHDIPDAAWVQVRKGGSSLPKFRSAKGVIAEAPRIGDYPGRQLGDESVVNYEDYPDVHDSHDENFFLRLDHTTENDGIISNFGLDSDGDPIGGPGYDPDTLEVEWETGILTPRVQGRRSLLPALGVADRG